MAKGRWNEKGTFDRMKALNVENVYFKILREHPISRIRISQETGLNKMTVTNCVKTLLEQDIVCELEQEESSVGRPPILLDLNPTLGVLIGIEINILGCKILVTDISGRILHQKIDETLGWNPQNFVKNVAEMVRAYQSDYGHWKKGVIGVGIALPGNYDHNTGIVEYISTLHQWDGFAIRAAFEEAIPDVPVYFQNAGRAGAKGEIDFGFAPFDLDMAYIHGAMGLTLSMYSSQGVHMGDKGFTGRFGHIIIDVHGRQCLCGNRGCLEMYASVGSLARTLYPEEKIGLSQVEELLSRKEKKESILEEELDQLIFYLAVGIGNIVNCFHPERVCIGNYLGLLLKGREEALNQAVNRLTLEHMRKENRIFVSNLGEWGAAFGCISTVRSQLIQNEEKSDAC
ncbi:ROK family protein [Hominifimenecus sp. rT4P-3]|uniref:ROK family protein n=1 Tax=Hominifimenecus sp. rT4P-3 TaxID=3242979 RepID=UPI003DA67D84